MSDQEKRTQGSPAKVKVEGSREKGGYFVQEEGKPKGILLLGPAPAAAPEAGAVIDVFVQDDDRMNPQYRWDSPVKRPKPEPKRFGRKSGRF